MKTKYIKVKVSDLPNEEQNYNTNQGLLFFDGVTFWQYEGRAYVKSNSNIDYVLVEVPDYEDEAVELFIEFLQMHRDYDMRPEDELYDYADKVTELVKKIKEKVTDKK